MAVLNSLNYVQEPNMLTFETRWNLPARLYVSTMNVMTFYKGS